MADAGLGGVSRVKLPALEEARKVLASADAVVFFTGAGMSAESGVPTFRGEEGLWRSYRPEELATPAAFHRDPGLVWEWYRWRRSLVAECDPNPGHRAVAEFCGRRGTTAIVTQNVDGLHQRAAEEAAGGESVTEGAAPILELHGRLFGDRCSGCGRRTSAGGVPAVEEALPRCRACGELLRPDVVWFGEGLDGAVLKDAFTTARSAELCLAVGTSAVVQPAASIPLATLEGGGILMEVNPDTTPLSRHARHSLRGSAGELLPALLGRGG